MLAKTNKGLNESVNAVERTADRYALYFRDDFDTLIPIDAGRRPRRSLYSR